MSFPIRARWGMAAAVALFLFVGRSQAQVVFTPPPDAPDGGAGTIGVLEVSGPVLPTTPPSGGIPGCCGDQNQARAALLAPPAAGIIRRTFTAPDFNFKGDGGAVGHFGNDNPINVPAGQFNDNKAYMFRGNIQVPASGTYTFNVNSDDGFTLAFNNGTVPFSNKYESDNGNPGAIVSYNGNANGALTFFGGRGSQDTGAQVTFPSAGVYHFDVSFHDGCCDDNIEISAAQGTKGSFDNSFALIGQQPSTKLKRFVTAGSWDTYTLANVANMAATIAAYNNGAPSANRSHSTEPTLAFNDPQNSNVGGHGADVRAFPGDTAADDNNFGTGARAPLTIAAANAGRYTIIVNSDDGFRFRILDNLGNPLTPIPGGNTMVDVGSGGLIPSGGIDACCQDFVGKYDLAAGNYTMEVIQNEMGGGAGLVVYGAMGDLNGFDPNSFQLIGQNLDTTVPVPGGLQLVPEPGTLGALSLLVVGGLLRRRRAA